MRHSKGIWKSVFTSNLSRAVRNEGGIICTLPKPSKYPGQDQRYDDELNEVAANQKLIEKAPAMLEILVELRKGFDGRHSWDALPPFMQEKIHYLLNEIKNS